MLQFRFLSLVCLLFGCCPGIGVIGAQTLNQSLSSPDTTAIKIGLLISEPENLAAKHGAELAIREANAKGGYSRQPFQLVVRSTEGPWGTGSKESVNLVFDEEVVAIIGSLDGRNAHLVEQVAAKTRIVCLSAWATEMTLSQAFVPWHYRCVPNDDQQSASLIQEIYSKRKITNVAVIGTEDYDSRNAVRSFIMTSASMKIAAPEQFLYRSSGEDFQIALNDINKNDIEAVVLFVKPAFASSIIPVLKKQNKDLAIFGSLLVTDDQKNSDPDWNILDGMTLITSGQWFTEKGIIFQKTFQEAFGYQPGAAAAYAYDGINLIIEAIKKNGPDRDKIIDTFTKINYKTGVTGEIRFDTHGNRIGIPDLMTIKNGIPIFIKTDK
jgi:branched-chain amino acid transport system substrate-binding protein